MRANRLSEEFDNGVIEFLQFAEQNLLNNDALFPCPCVSCANREPNITKEEITSGIKTNVGKGPNNFLFWNGICQTYTQWIWHGEAVLPSVSQRENVSVDMDDRLEDMMHDIGDVLSIFGYQSIDWF